MSGALQIVVPGTCPNRCHFCVSLLHDQSMYPNRKVERQEPGSQGRIAYRRRLAYARDEGCDTLIYTGVYNEALFNPTFMKMVAEENRALHKPFRKLEIQTTGIGLRKNKWDFLRDECEVSTLALSVSDMFDDKNNGDINRTPDGLRFNLDEFCKEALEHDFNIRLTVIMSDVYNDKSAEDLFIRAKKVGAQQIIFKHLATYEPAFNGEAREINAWIKSHQPSEDLVEGINTYVIEHGKMVEPLPFGDRYSVHGISTVIDVDCMKKERPQPGRYLILRENCRLYTRWDDQGSAEQLAKRIPNRVDKLYVVDQNKNPVPGALRRQIRTQDSGGVSEALSEDLRNLGEPPHGKE